MADDSVNVESRTSSQDKRWTIMAALLGTNTAVMLFQGIEQAENPKFFERNCLSNYRSSSSVSSNLFSNLHLFDGE